MYGKTAYLAEDAAYCDEHGYRYNVPAGAGTAQMMLLRVAAATAWPAPAPWTESYRSIVKPTDGFDSVYGTVAAGFMAIMVRTVSVQLHLLCSHLARRHGRTLRLR